MYRPTCGSSFSRSAFSTSARFWLGEEAIALRIARSETVTVQSRVATSALRSSMQRRISATRSAAWRRMVQGTNRSWNPGRLKLTGNSRCRGSARPVSSRTGLTGEGNSG